MLNGTLFDTIVKILITLAIGGLLIGILPASPFPSIIETIGELPMIGYINWFIPVGKLLGILYAWASAIVIFFGIAWIFRQLGIIGQ